MFFSSSSIFFRFFLSVFFSRKKDKEKFSFKKNEKAKEKSKKEIVKRENHKIKNFGNIVSKLPKLQKLLLKFYQKSKIGKQRKKLND